MRAYLWSSGLVFALVVVAHIARMVAEGPQVIGQPIFAVSTLLSLGLTGWSVALLRSTRRR